MIKAPRLKNSIIVALVASVGVAGCATTQNGGGNTVGGGSADSGECNVAAAALVGGVVGALLGNGNNHLRGAAIGAGLASLACVAWNYNSRQTKTAAQVGQEYRMANRGQLPARSTVTRYETNVGSGGKVVPGQNLVVASNIEVVQGTADNNLLIEEEITLHRPDGVDMKKRKTANPNQGAGGYSTTYSVPMPEGVQQGVYPIQTALYVNGARMASNNKNIQVVSLPSGELVAMLR